MTSAEIISNFYGDNVELMEWFQEDGHHSDLADFSSDPLMQLIAEEEEAELH